MYNEVLELQLPGDGKLIGFADDIILLVQASTIAEVETMAMVALVVIERWMRSVELRLALHKAEYILVSSHQREQRSEIIIQGHTIREL